MEGNANGLVDAMSLAEYYAFDAERLRKPPSQH
jgi:hypothetical protein